MHGCLWPGALSAGLPSGEIPGAALAGGAGLVFIWLLPRMSLNLLAFNLGATLYILTGAVFEERKLLNTFGSAYAGYRRRTPMLVPGLRLSRRP